MPSKYRLSALRADSWEDDEAIDLYGIYEVRICELMLIGYEGL